MYSTVQFWIILLSSTIQKYKEKWKERLSLMSVWNSESFIQFRDVLMFSLRTYVLERMSPSPAFSPSEKLVEPEIGDLLEHSLVKGCGSPLEGLLRPSKQWNRQRTKEFACWKQFFPQTRVLHAVDSNRRVRHVLAGTP